MGHRLTEGLPRIIACVLHALVLGICAVSPPDGWRSVYLLVAWMVSAVALVWLSAGQRTVALVVLLISTVLMWKTIIYVLLSFACVRGDCI